MNYKAELRGFAVDRSLRLAEIAGDKNINFDSIKVTAEKIVDYLYIPEKDIQSHLESVMPLIRKCGEADKITALIAELQQVEAEIRAGV